MIPEAVLSPRLARHEYPDVLSVEQKAGFLLAFAEGSDDRFVEESAGDEADGTPTTWLVTDGERQHLVVCVDDPTRDRCDCGRFRKSLRGAYCRHIYGVLYRARPPKWVADPVVPPTSLAAQRMPLAARNADLPDYLTQRAGPYNVSLMYADQQFYPFLRRFLDHTAPKIVAEKPRPGRPRKETRDVLNALFVRVRQKATLRATTNLVVLTEEH